MKTETRKTISKDARQTIRDCVSNGDAIAAGLRIAACKFIRRKDATAAGCLRVAAELATELAKQYTTTTLTTRLARYVARRDWYSLWYAARGAAYPYSALTDSGKKV